MGRKQSAKHYKEGNPGYWESEQFNALCYYTNIEMLQALAINRFQWEGLPDTCDARFLEQNLHRYGVATICHDEGMPDVWQTLMAQPNGGFNAYGLPVSWRAKGYDTTDYMVTPENGELVFYAQARANPCNGFSPWTAIIMYANKLTQYQRTEDVNLYNQRHMQVWCAPREKRIELANLLKQSSGFEPVVLGDNSLLPLSQDNVFCISVEDPLIVEELGKAYQNVLNQYLMFMGIPHLAFEKGERMIEDEAHANTAPTTVMLLNCLDARRQACKRLRELDPVRFADLNVYFNDDWESYNFNYINNIESQAQDGLLQAPAEGEEEGADDGEQQ